VEAPAAILSFRGGNLCESIATRGVGTAKQVGLVLCPCLGEQYLELAAQGFVRLAECIAAGGEGAVLKQGRSQSRLSRGQAEGVAKDVW
jgi:hypothetical protein